MNLEIRIRSKAKSLVKKAKRDPVFAFLFLVTILLGVFFRLYNWHERIYIHADNSLYAQIAKYALDTLSIPQIGVFPQAQFFTGPEWLWGLQIFYLLPFGILSPWYAMTFLSIVLILLIFWTAKQVGNKWVGLLAAFFTSISTAQIDNSFSVWNAAADPFLGILSLIFLIRFYKYKRKLDIFLISFIVSFAITVRFQNFITMPVIFIALFLAKFRFKYILTCVFGFFIPFLPFLIFDLRFDWFEFKRFYDYVTVAQYRIYVPNRWLTYAGDWWPQMWGYAIGGNKLIGILLISLVSFFTLTNFLKFRKNILFFLIAISFALEVIIFRYFRGERYVYYSLFAHGPILILSAWVLWRIFKFQKYFALILIFIISFLTLKQSFKNLASREITLSKIESFKEEIYDSNNAESYDIYGCSYNGSRIGRALALLIYGDGKNKEGGLKIGVCEGKGKYEWVVLTDEEVANRNAWFAATTSTTHREAIEWWKENPPK